MTSPLERLAGPGQPLTAEPPDAAEFEGLKRSGLSRLHDADRDSNHDRPPSPRCVAIATPQTQRTQDTVARRDQRRFVQAALERSDSVADPDGRPRRPAG